MATDIVEREMCTRCENRSFKSRATLRLHERRLHGIYIRGGSAHPPTTEDSVPTLTIGPVPERILISIRNGTKSSSILCHVLSLPEVVDAIAGGIRQAITHKGIKV